MTITYLSTPDRIEITDAYLASGTDFTATMRLHWDGYEAVEVEARRIEDILGDDVYPDEEWTLPDNVEFAGKLADWQDEFLQELMQTASNEAHKILEEQKGRMLAVLNQSVV